MLVIDDVLSNMHFIQDEYDVLLPLGTCQNIGSVHDLSVHTQ